MYHIQFPNSSTVLSFSSSPSFLGNRETGGGMKFLSSLEILTAPLFVKTSAVALITFTFFYLGNHWSQSDGYQHLVFFNNSESPPSIFLSSNSSIDLIPNRTDAISTVPPVAALPPEAPPPFHPPPAALAPPPPPVRFGIIDENGAMRDDFVVGEFNSDRIEMWGEGDQMVGNGEGSGNAAVRFRTKKFRLCPDSMREYIPCLDNVEAIRKLTSKRNGEKFERHCPGKGKRLDCLVPAPKGYKAPIPWPKSREQVWYSNVPHPRLAEDKGGQNWISIEKDKFKFPGGGTQFIHGADQYLDQISQMVSHVAFGHHTRVVLDVGCGVASFGAFLLSRDVLPLSIAPKDVHENQIQFALERGVPAMVAAFATRRLLYPSQAFDLIHCSRCRINWTRDDGILLLEVNRMLRAGGYFVWAAQPFYKHEDKQQEAWKEMEDLTARICWELVKKEGYLAIWQKPLNNSCYVNRGAGVQPPLCESHDDPDNVWYVDLKLKACITRLPENGYGANVTNWPARLHYPPDRLQTVEMDAYIAKKELFKAESKYWNDIVASYVHAYHWKKLKLRNVMDMRAGFGGFAAALIDQGINAWVMNVVPISGPNTLPVIYDRGLIGVVHDWCEPFDTYPRTYDLLHASALFATEQKLCNISTIMLEMDRILRPGGRAYIRDTTSIIEEVQEIAVAMGWRAALHDTSEGPYASRRVLMCDKHLSRH